MTTSQPNCEPWDEPVSLLAAGCFSADEERDVRRHLETCTSCRERFGQLASLCRQIEAAQPVNALPEAAIVAQAMREIDCAHARPRGWLAGRRAIAAGLAVAASVLLMLAWQGLFSPDRHRPRLVEGPRLPERVPSPQPPTLLAYERAFAESDEAFDQLLNSEAQRLAFLSTHESPLAWTKEVTP